MHTDGFTLFELMVVIVIIAFLSMLSVPNVMKFLAKAKRSEAYVYLRTLAHAQKLYCAEHGSYTKNIAGPQGLGWKPEGGFHYTYGFPDGALNETHVIGSLKTPSTALAGASISQKGFTILAAGTVYGDKPDIISINEAHEIKILSDALT